MYLWEAAQARQQEQADHELVTAYIAARDAYGFIQTAKSGKRAKDPEYVEKMRRNAARKAPRKKGGPAETMAQLAALQVRYPDRVDVIEVPGAGSSSARNGTDA
jgi:hypothetical protein